MPLYEYHCPSCELTFEALEPLRGARRPGTCPRCMRRAPRVSSAFSVAGGRSGSEGKRPNGSATQQAKAERPLCLRYPQLPLLCHMDRPSAERFVAHAQGRGAQYDDGVAAREELRKKRGDPPPAGAAPSEHAHVHGHSHSHDHSRSHDHSHGGGEAHSHARRYARHSRGSPDPARG